MKIELNREILVKKLATALSVMKDKSILPILDCALFQFNEGRMNVTSSDMEITIKTSMEYELIEGEEVIDFVVDPEVISRTIQTLKAETVWIEFSPAEKTISFGTKATRKKYTVSAQLKPEDFPLPRYDEMPEKIELSGANLSKSISTCARFTNKNDLRAAFTGVLLRSKDGKATLCGTNSNVIASFEFDSLTDFSDTIIPRNIAKVINEFKDSVIVTISKSVGVASSICVEDGNVSVTMRAVDAVFPPVNKIFDQINMEIKTVFPRVEVLEAIRRSVSFQDMINKGALLDFTDSSLLLIKAQNKDFRKASTEEIEFISKDPFFNYRTQFNSEYITSIFSILEGDNIIFSQAGEKGCAAIRDDKEKGYSSMFAVMPQMIMG